MVAPLRFGQAQTLFRPTAASIPPQGAKLVLSVPPGLPHNAHPLNPLEFLLRGATIYPDHLALAHPDVAHPAFYTYAVFAQRVQNLAYALLDAGVRPGDRVAVIAPNCPMIAEALQAAIAARAIVVTINTRLTPAEVAYILDHSSPRVVLVDHEYVYLLPKPSPFPTNTSAPSSSRSQPAFKVVIGQDTGKEGCPYEDFLSEGRRKSGEKGWEGLEMHTDENAPFCLNYTSGTTGRPKGVLTTLRGTYLAAIANAYEARMTSESTYLWVLPMFHAAGWTFPWACTFAFSTQLTIRSVNYQNIWKHFLNFGVTHYCGAPTVQIGIVNDPLARPLPHEIKAIIAGAAPTANLLGALEQKGIAPVHVYGLTETYGPFVRNFAQPSWKELSLNERAALTARQGHAFATSTPARVVYPLSDEDGGKDDVELVDVPKDGHTVGEVVMRGNIAMAGYYRDPGATAKAFRGGYFHSGDLAVWYPDGAIQIQDRSKDLIISGGENASSLAIETALAAHADVLEVAVVGRAHEKWGERAMAFVMLRADAVKKWKGRHKEFARELIKHARGQLPGFATPEWVVVVDELPKTLTGKILKTVLRKHAAEEAEREGQMKAKL
ncbi:unnamed protein product [Peniophora sp. CBMAI 1063]|nr:unnamed protein product [Peniophora sp. CBMAI 1063]